jgi:hypothetical protein
VGNKKKMTEEKASAPYNGSGGGGSGGDVIPEWRWYHIGTVYALYLPPLEMRQPMVPTSTLHLDPNCGMVDAPERDLDRRSLETKSKEDPRDRDINITHYDLAYQLVIRFRKERVFDIEALRCNVYFKSSKITPDEFKSMLGRELIFLPPITLAPASIGTSPTEIAKSSATTNPPKPEIERGIEIKVATTSSSCEEATTSIRDNHHTRCRLKSCRVPCGEMNLPCPGLFKAMKGDKAGLFARVMQGDAIVVGDEMYCRMSAAIASMYRLTATDIRADLDVYVEIDPKSIDTPKDEKDMLN